MRTSVMLACLLVSSPGFGREDAPATGNAPDARSAAADDFDVGVRHYADAQYEAAARAFLRADARMNASDAMFNALASAEKSGDHLLVVEVAQHALAREVVDPGLQSRARAALASSSRFLARVELSCAPEPCSLLLDEEPVDPGVRFVNPGTHRVAARSTAGEGERPTTEKYGVLEPGASYVYRLHVADASEAQRETPQSPAPSSSHGSTRLASSGAQPFPSDAKPRPDGDGPSRDVWLLGAGIATTAVLTGATIASGVDAASAHATLSNVSTVDEVDAVREKIVRTDVLLACSITTALVTTVWAFAFADLRSGSSDVALASLEGGFWIAYGERW